MIFPSSGTGAWEAAIVNTLSPGDKVLMFETGQFATLWKEHGGRISGLDVQFVAERLAAWRRSGRGGIDSARGSRPQDQGRDAWCTTRPRAR